MPFTTKDVLGMRGVPATLIKEILDTAAQLKPILSTPKRPHTCRQHSDAVLKIPPAPA